MTTLDEARNFAIYLRSARSPWMEHDRIYHARQDAARIIDDLIAMVEVPVSDVEIEAAASAIMVVNQDTSGLPFSKFCRRIARAALEAAAAARSQNKVEL